MILRFPSKEDPDRRDLMFVSSYTFIINEDNQMTLLVQVKDSKGKEVRLDQFLRTDVEDRKYSVTTDKFSRLLEFNIIFYQKSIISRLAIQREVHLKPEDLKPNIKVTRVSIGGMSNSVKKENAEAEYDGGLDSQDDHLFADIL